MWTTTPPGYHLGGPHKRPKGGEELYIPTLEGWREFSRSPRKALTRGVGSHNTLGTQEKRAI